MLDLQYILDNPKIIKDAIANKGVRGIAPEDVDTIVSLIQEVKSSSTEIQGLRERRNENSGKIQNATAEERPAIIEEGKKLKEEISTLEEGYREKKAELDRLVSFLPGIPSEDTPVGENENGNVEEKTWGDKPDFDFEPKHHMDLLIDLGMLDIERGTKVGGFRGYFLKGDAVMLQWATLMFALNKLQEKGYELTIPPTLVKDFSLFGTGHFPWGEVDVYEVGKPGEDETGKEISDSMYLVGTAEVPLMGMYANETLKLESKAKKMAGISPCYRREVGSHHRDLRGIFRIHEFFKVEQVVIMEPNDEAAEQVHQELTANAEEILQELNIPYRVLAMCTGDMGEPQYKKFDIESWMPGRGSYGETHSSSNMRDFQCRRNNIRVELEDGTKAYAYSLNNTAIALPRFLIALVENNQTKDGKIMIPEPLQKYMGGKKIIG